MSFSFNDERWNKLVCFEHSHHFADSKCLWSETSSMTRKVTRKRSYNVYLLKLFTLVCISPVSIFIGPYNLQLQFLAGLGALSGTLFSLN